MSDEPPRTPASFDWSSCESDGSSEVADWKCEVHVVSPSVFRKASRRRLGQQKESFYSQEQNTVGMSKPQLLSARALQDFENYLALVSLMYYGDPQFAGKKNANGTLRPLKRSRGKDPLEFLLSPLRADYVYGETYTEKWSPKEIAVFECGLCRFGKEFGTIEKLLRLSKTRAEITQFYHMWKQTSHYKAWKDADLKESLYALG